MYAEKRSIVIDRQVNASFSIHQHITFSMVPNDNNAIQLHPQITLENVGMKKIPVIQFALQVMIKDENGRDWKVLTFASDFSLSKMKILEREEIWILDRPLSTGVAKAGLNRDSTLKMLNTYKAQRKFVEFRPLTITTISDDSFPCAMHVIEYKRDNQ